MAERELRKLKRTELVDIIYQLQKSIEEMEAENLELRRQLEDRRIKIENAGSLAEAVVGLNEIFENAQRAADQYVEQLRRNAEESIV